MSGLSHTPGKRAWGKTHRGFESRLLRQKSKNPVALYAAGFFVAFPYLGLLVALHHLHGRGDQGRNLTHVGGNDQRGRRV